jgi:hypothetical protein
VLELKDCLPKVLDALAPLIPFPPVQGSRPIHEIVSEFVAEWVDRHVDFDPACIGRYFAEFPELWRGTPGGPTIRSAIEFEFRALVAKRIGKMALATIAATITASAPEEPAGAISQALAAMPRGWKSVLPRTKSREVETVSRFLEESLANVADNPDPASFETLSTVARIWCSVIPTPEELDPSEGSDFERAILTILSCSERAWFIGEGLVMPPFPQLEDRIPW